MSEVVTTIEEIKDNAFTITVQDWRGEKQVTLEEYIDAWLEPSRSLMNLVNHDGDFDEVKAIQAQVKELATRNFWTLHRREAKNERYPNKQN